MGIYVWGTGCGASERGGPFNIQLSGGEPTMRNDLDQVIALGREKGFSFFRLNINGVSRFANGGAYLFLPAF